MAGRGSGLWFDLELENNDGYMKNDFSFMGMRERKWSSGQKYGVMAGSERNK